MGQGNTEVLYPSFPSVQLMQREKGDINAHVRPNFGVRSFNGCSVSFLCPKSLILLRTAWQTVRSVCTRNN